MAWTKPKKDMLISKPVPAANKIIDMITKEKDNMISKGLRPRVVEMSETWRDAIKMDPWFYDNSAIQMISGLIIEINEDKDEGFKVKE